MNCKLVGMRCNDDAACVCAPQTSLESVNVMTFVFSRIFIFFLCAAQWQKRSFCSWQSLVSVVFSFAYIRNVCATMHTSPCHFMLLLSQWCYFNIGFEIAKKKMFYRLHKAVPFLMNAIPIFRKKKEKGKSERDLIDGMQSKQALNWRPALVNWWIRYFCMHARCFSKITIFPCSIPSFLLVGILSTSVALLLSLPRLLLLLALIPFNFSEIHLSRALFDEQKYLFAFKCGFNALGYVPHSLVCSLSQYHRS